MSVLEAHARVFTHVEQEVQAKQLSSQSGS